MEIQAKPVEHDVKIIVVPSEKIGNSKISDVKITGFKILDYYEIYRGDQQIHSLILLAVGREMNPETIWTTYKKSERLIFFICQKSNYSTE